MYNIGPCLKAWCWTWPSERLQLHQLVSTAWWLHQRWGRPSLLQQGTYAAALSTAWTGSCSRFRNHAQIQASQHPGHRWSSCHCRQSEHFCHRTFFGTRSSASLDSQGRQGSPGEPPQICRASRRFPWQNPGDQTGAQVSGQLQPSPVISLPSLFHNRIRIKKGSLDPHG